MIAAWMVYCALCALGLSLAAVLAERALLRGRAPVRFVWVAAVALSLAVPAIALRFPSPAAVVEVNPFAPREVESTTPTDLTRSAPAVVPETPRSPAPRRDWRTVATRFDGTLSVAWILLSIAVAINLLGGITALAWLRRGWQRRTILGVPVLMSERTGPAVVGAVSPAIVLPEWVLALESSQLALMLRHEQEHRRAGDVQLLTLAQLALVAMPWNPALWWQIVRLRVAVEMDCDARVLRDADPRSYGDLLLEVARPRRTSFVGAMAFAERATQLERRIRVLSRHRVTTSRRARIGATCVGLVALSVAWVAPRPPAPPRVVVSHAASMLPRLTSVPTDTAPAIKPIAVATIPVRPAARPARKPIKQPAPVARIVSVNPCDATGMQPMVDTIFVHLFAGIAVTPDQQMRACDMLLKLDEEQRKLDVITQVTLETNRLNRLAVQARRDTALRQLLTNDADRATLDARLAQESRGGGRRGGGPAPVWNLPPGGRGAADSVIAALGGGRGRGGGGRGGGRGGGAGFGDTAIYRQMVADVSRLTVFSNVGPTMLRLFDGIVLTPGQDSRARDIIRGAQEELQALRPPFTAPVLLWNGMTGLVTMQATSLPAFLALLSNDTERAMLRARVNSAMTVTTRPY